LAQAIVSPERHASAAHCAVQPDRPIGEMAGASGDKPLETASPEPASPFRGDVLAGRVVLVTGGATGIGLGCCKAFGKHGAKVAIMGRRQQVLEDAVKELGALGIEAFGVQGDVRDFAKCEAVCAAVFERFGRLDFLINNAAGNFMVPSEQLTPNGYATVLGIDLQGCFHMSRAALPHLKVTGPTDGAVILNISATLQDHATPFQAHAASAKAGIDVLTNTLGVEWAEYGVRTIGLAPGGISGTVGGPSGRVFGQAGQAGKSVEETKDPPPSQLRRGGVPAGRWGRIDDIALAAVYMCTSAAGWITATRLTIDGGSCHPLARGFPDMKRMITSKSDAEKKSFKGGVSKL